MPTRLGWYAIAATCIWFGLLFLLYFITDVDWTLGLIAGIYILIAIVSVPKEESEFTFSVDKLEVEEIGE